MVNSFMPAAPGISTSGPFNAPPADAAGIGGTSCRNGNCDDNDNDDNGASTLIEAPATTLDGSQALKRHDFPDGGGSSGAEAFRRTD